ncbi:MAG: hypothetical protein WBA31_07545 [Candidatus Dormiibacterota bacterium]
MPLALIWTILPVSADTGWWVAAPGGTPPISAIASDQGSTTLAISKGVAGWYSPTSGRFSEIKLPSRFGPALAVGASGRQGVIAFARGELVEAGPTGRVRPLPRLSGSPRALAVFGQDPVLVAVATSTGLFSGRLRTPLSKITSGNGGAVIAPPTPGRAWLALVSGRLWQRPPGGHWTLARSAPRFAATTSALTELATGIVLVGEPEGLIWRGDGDRWARSFQVLPYGGLSGVPTVTALVADGATSAYLATDGFGTLLTPDGGYTWYRAPPPDASVSQLATMGPVFSSHAHGLVVAVSPSRLYLHRLQELPQPPTYSPASASAELAGTAAVTVGSIFLVTLLLWWWSRRRRGLSV